LLVLHPEVREWLHEVRKTDRLTAALIGQAIQHVIDGRGPDEGRPLVDRIKGSQLHHLKELRPASTSDTEVRILAGPSEAGSVWQQEFRRGLLAPDVLAWAVAACNGTGCMVGF